MTENTLKIGPTFFWELKAANPTGEGCGYNEYTGVLTFPDGTSQQFITYAEGVLAAHDPTKPYIPVPEVISDRQFFQWLATNVNPSSNTAYITQDEAKAAMAAVLPAAMVTLVDQLPTTEQFTAQIELMGSTAFERSNPFVPTIGQLYGMTSAQLDTLWIEAAQL